MKIVLYVIVAGLCVCRGSAKDLTAEQLRVDCHPEPGATAGRCLERGCLYDYAQQLTFIETPR